MRHFPLFLWLGLFTLPLCLVSGAETTPAKSATAPSVPQSEPADALSLAVQGLSVTPNEIMANVVNLIKRREYQLADDVLASLLDKPNVVRPVQAQAVYLRGRLALAEAKPAEAIIWFRRYVQDFADQMDAPYVNFLLGQTYKQIGAYDRARENFYKTLSFAVSKASSMTIEDYTASVRLTQAAAWELAESEYLSNNWARAEELYERFKNQNPDLEILVSTSLYRMADCDYQLGKNSDAITRYELALGQSPFHPFSTEAWLRLVSLYGQTGEQKKQVDAMRCFIWMVNNLNPEDKLYWQRRCADMLLLEYKDKPERQIPVLEAIVSFDNSESWMKMLDFYLSLLNRQVAATSTNKSLAPSDKAQDDWRNWLNGFSEKLRTLRKDFEQVRANDLPRPSGAPALK